MILALVTSERDTDAFWQIAAGASADVIPIDLRFSFTAASDPRAGMPRVSSLRAATSLLLSLSERGPVTLLCGLSLTLTDLEAMLVRHALEAGARVLALSAPLELWRVVGVTRDVQARAQLEIASLFDQPPGVA